MKWRNDQASATLHDTIIGSLEDSEIFLLIMLLKGLISLTRRFALGIVMEVYVWPQYIKYNPRFGNNSEFGREKHNCLARHLLSDCLVQNISAALHTLLPHCLVKRS